MFKLFSSGNVGHERERSVRATNYFRERDSVKHHPHVHIIEQWQFINFARYENNCTINRERFSMSTEKDGESMDLHLAVKSKDS